MTRQVGGLTVLAPVEAAELRRHNCRAHKGGAVITALQSVPCSPHLAVGLSEQFPSLESKDPGLRVCPPVRPPHRQAPTDTPPHPHLGRTFWKVSHCSRLVTVPVFTAGCAPISSLVWAKSPGGE